MNRKFLLCLLCVFVLVFSGCVAISPVGGLVQTVKWDGVVGEQSVSASKEGIACAKSYLGLYADGDASLSKAMEVGGIKKINKVEHKTTSWVFVAEYCTIVTGE